MAGLSELSFSLLFSGIAPGSEDSVVSSVVDIVENVMCSGRTTYVSSSVRYAGGKRKQKNSFSHAAILARGLSCTQLHPDTEPKGVTCYWVCEPH